MSLTTAIRDRDVTELPGKRDEDWRWTDLRGLIRKLPPPSEPFSADVGAGPFDALATDRRVIASIRARLSPILLRFLAARALWSRPASSRVGRASTSPG